MNEKFEIVGVIEHGNRSDFRYLRQELLRSKFGNYMLRSEGGEYTECGQYVGFHENGNWYEWDDASGAYTDTGKPSRGEKGNTGAEGADGADGRDGITPTIGENGNWYLGDTDTGKPSRGADGATGATGATGEKGADGKSAYQYAVEGGYTGTEAEFAAKLAGSELPTVGAEDNGKILRVVDGAWSAAALQNAEEVAF